MSIYLRSNITGSGVAVADWNNSISAVLSADSITAGTINVGDTVTIQLSNASASGKTLNVNGVSVTPTAQDSSSISFLAMDLFTFAGGIYRFAEDIPVTVVDGAESDSITYQTTPDTGYTQFAVPDPIAGVWASTEFSTAIDPQVLAIGDYIWCTDPADSDAPNGSFPEASSIDYRIMDMSDGTPAWGDEGTITVTSNADTTPAAFTFTDVTDQNLSTVVESNTITVTDVDAATDVAISITGGEYAVSTDGGSSFGSWTSSSGNVQLNHQVKVRGTSSASYSTAVNVVLTVGGVSDTFSITTKADDVAPVITLTGDATINLVEGDTYTEQGATWTDNVDGSGAATVGGDTVDANTVGSYVVTYDYTDAAGNAATQVTRTVNVTAAPDTTAPVLSSPTATAQSARVVAGTVTTDEGNGSIYYVATANSSETSGYIIANGSTRAAAVGVNEVSQAGATPEATYYMHYVHVDAAGNTSNVVSSSSVTLPEAPALEPGSSNEQAIAFFRNETGLSTYSLNELAIAYYKQVSASVLGSYNDLQCGAQQTEGFVGESPVDWRNYL